MISQTDLDRIIKAKKYGTLDSLIESFQAEISEKEMTKKGSVKIEVSKGYGNNATPVFVVAKKVSDAYALHKSVNARGYTTITHIETGISVLEGDKRNVLDATKEFLSWEHLDVLTKAIKEKQLNGLEGLDEKIVKEYRKMYEKAKGRE